MMRNSQYSLSLRASRVAAAAIFALSANFARADDFGASAPSRLISDAPGTDGAQLCLAADLQKPLNGPFTVPAASQEGKTHVVTGPFYPVVVASCGAIPQGLEATWTATARRELTVPAKGGALCLTLRPMGAFEPLVDPYLAAFGAGTPNSPLAYLVDDLKPNGAINAKRVGIAPDLVVGPCGLSDAVDSWVYDDPSGTISAPAGPTRRRACVTLHFDHRAKSETFAPGTPVFAAYCVDSADAPDRSLEALDRASLPPVQRWRLETGADALPTFVKRDDKDYFSGRSGLPITGPMGRCLSADPTKGSLFTTDCDGRVEQDWKYVDNQIKLEAKNLCLAANTDGSAALNPCSQERNQFWAYTVRDPLAGKDWVKAEVFGQLRPLDEPTKCLGVVKDPFSDPWLRRNPLKVFDCSGVEPRQTNWFVTKNVQTVRVALLRFGHSPDHLPMPKRSDDDLKATFQLEMERLSAQYRRLGVRFVFDPDHDFLHIEDKVADDPKNGKAIAAAIAKIAADQFYGKIAVALSERGTPGGTSAWNVEYNPDRSVDPVSGGKFDYPRWKQDSDSFFDKSGLPAVSNFIDVGAVEVRLDSLATLRQAQEFGRYFSLNPLHVSPAPADAPEDNDNWRAWIDAGAPPCGNLARLSLNGKTFQPDRTNAEGYWGCAIGRSLSALTPMQLARADWTLRYQLDRIALTACGPAGSYNGDVVRCDGEEALALCQETSAYLRKISSGAETSGVPSRRHHSGRDPQGDAMAWPAIHFQIDARGPGSHQRARRKGAESRAGRRQDV